MKCWKLSLFLLLLSAMAVLGSSAEFSTYALLKELDIPEYDEWRMGFGVDTYTWENYGFGGATFDEDGWHESRYTLSLEWCVWPFPFGDLNVGLQLPYYFWFAKDKTEKDNAGAVGALTTVGGFMDPEVFAELKIPFLDSLSFLLHAQASLPGLIRETAEEGGASLGVMRLTLMGGVIVEFNRFIAKAMGGVESGGTPDVNPTNRTPSLLVPQVAAYDNSSVMVLDLEVMFCATATTGFGIQYLAKGTYFEGSSWTGSGFPTDPDGLGMLILKLYFANTSGGFYGSEKGIIMSLGIGKGGMPLIPGTKIPFEVSKDLNPRVLYTFSFSKYF